MSLSVMKNYVRETKKNPNECMNPFCHFYSLKQDAKYRTIFD